MGLWDGLFGRSKEPVRIEGEDDVRPELMEVTQGAVASILVQNFMIMELEPKSVPLSGSTGSFRSSGYLVGLTEAVLGQFDAMSPTKA
ncbi:hypothetical protein [Novosphingobium sp.]|uniref:hypothetical protein n=1 Tax=Novosphingobium sp. TaxID=1874826 RepID=UPI0025D5A475|nr:hypothetical protein [Novosphingobium sp.]